MQPSFWLVLGLTGHAVDASKNNPSPPTQGLGWEDAFNRAKSFLAGLSLEDKAELVTGRTGPCVGNIGSKGHDSSFRGICLQDGPLAIRAATNVSVFPAGLTTAATWDRQLARMRGSAIGAEFKGKGAHVALGPVVGPLGKNALDGRYWEGFGVDPYLAGVMAEETIPGMQASGVQACVKHFIGNEQETNRGESLVDLTDITAISSNIDDTTTHEVYMWPFANAVRAGVASTMCSYNKVNGTFACENDKVLNDLLKTELGFQGYVVSDWLAQHSTSPTANAGMDLAMPGGSLYVSEYPTFWRQNLANAVKLEQVNESRLDDMVLRVMTPYFQLGQDKDYPYVDSTSASMSIFLPNNEVNKALVGGESGRDVTADHAGLIRQIGVAGAVLLKNERSALPLSKLHSIGVFGNDAGSRPGSNLQVTTNYEDGTLPVGGGSGTGHFDYVIDPLAAIKEQVSRNGTVVLSNTNNEAVISGFYPRGSFLGLSGSSSSSNSTSAEPDVCLVFLKTYKAEASDSTTLASDWRGDDLVTRVASNCRNTVVVTHSGAANILPWSSHPNVTAILAAHYPGQESGHSISDILFGAVNPSGHLPYTIARAAADYPSTPRTGLSLIDDFAEGRLIDYRWFDAHNIEPAFPFGHGLSYTTFALSTVTAAASQTSLSPTPATAPITPGGNPALWAHVASVTATLTNTGRVAGAAVPQLYIALPGGGGGGGGAPVRVLRGFDKIMLAPGESRSVTFDLARRDVSSWNTIAQEWAVPSGAIVASVGFSSRDLRGEASFTLV